MTSHTEKPLAALALTGLVLALTPASATAQSGPTIHSPLTENDVVVGGAKDALIQVIQPGVHPYVAAGYAGFKEEAATLGDQRDSSTYTSKRPQLRDLVALVGDRAGGLDVQSGDRS